MDKSWSCEINDLIRANQTDAGAAENALHELGGKILELFTEWRQGDGLRLRLRLEIHTPPIP